MGSTGNGTARLVFYYVPVNEPLATSWGFPIESEYSLISFGVISFVIIDLEKQERFKFVDISKAIQIFPRTSNIEAKQNYKSFHSILVNYSSYLRKIPKKYKN